MRSALTWPVVLWDYDGTIADTIPAIIAAHHVATEAVLGTRLDESAIRSLIGEPAHQRIATLVPDHAEEVYAIYIEHMRNVPPAATPAFAGVPRIITRLWEMGATNALVTSRPRGHVVAPLAAFGLDRCFSAVVGLEDTQRHKPHGDPLLFALAELGAPAAGSVYIGDAVLDLESAHEAGIDSIAVTWGAGLADALLLGAPSVLATSPKELAHALGVEDEAAA